MSYHTYSANVLSTCGAARRARHHARHARHARHRNFLNFYIYTFVKVILGNHFSIKRHHLKFLIN